MLQNVEQIERALNLTYWSKKQLRVANYVVIPYPKYNIQTSSKEAMNK